MSSGHGVWFWMSIAGRADRGARRPQLLRRLGYGISGELRRALNPAISRSIKLLLILSAQLTLGV